MAKKKVKHVGRPRKEYIAPVTKHYHKKTVYVNGYYRLKPEHRKKS